MGFLAADDNYILGSVDEHLAILETDQSTLNTVTIYLAVNLGHSMTFDWGDGNTDAVVCDGTLKTVTHDYSSTGTYSIRLAGDIDQVTDFRAYNQSWIQGSILGFASLENVETLYLYSTSVSGAISIIDGLTSLTALNLASTSVTGSLADITALTSLTELNLSSTAISGALSNVSGMTSLDDLQLQSSSASGDIADLATLTAATNINLSGSSVDTYTQGALPAWAGLDIDISDLGLDSVEVDDFLIDLEDGDGAGGSVTIDGTNAAHSTASDAAITALEGNSWTITRNDYLVTSNQTGGLNTTTVTLRVPAGNAVTIDWGDGNSEAVTCNGSNSVHTHDYSTQEKWGIKLTGDYDETTLVQVINQSWIEGELNGPLSEMVDLLYLFVYSTGLSGDLSDLSSLTSLNQVSINSTSITGSTADVAAWTSLQRLFATSTSLSGSLSSLTGLPLTHLWLSGTSVTGDISSLSAMTSMLELILNGLAVTGSLSDLSSLTSMQKLWLLETNVDGDIADVAVMPNLTQLFLYGSDVDTYTGSTALPAWGSCDIRIYDLGLSATEVDDFLIDLESGGGNGNNGTLDIAGTNATRTSASDTAKANLIADGWSITVNE